MASLFETFLDNTEALVAGIVAGEGADVGSDGYNFTWDTQNVNAWDMARKVPGPWVDFEAVSEEPTDAEGATGGVAASLVRVKMIIGFRYDEAPENPIRQAQIDTMKAYDDLKRLFWRAEMTASGNTTGAFSFDRQVVPVEFGYATNDKLNPVVLTAYWIAKFYQDRRNPDLGAL